MSDTSMYTRYEDLEAWLKVNVGYKDLAELADGATNPYDLERLMTQEQVLAAYALYGTEMWAKVFELAEGAGDDNIFHFLDVCYVEDYEQVQAVVAGLAIIEAARRITEADREEHHG